MWGLLGFDLRPTRLQALLGVRTLLGMHHQQKESSLNLAGFVRPTQRAEMTHQRAEMTMNPYRSQKCASSLHHALCFPRLRGDLVRLRRDLVLGLPRLRLRRDLVLVLPRLRARRQ